MKRIVYSIIAIFSVFLVNAQSNNCNTATPITLVNGQACVNGSTVGATSANYLYGACNSVSLNEVWYTYTATGANNTFSIASLGITNAQIVIYSGGCPGSALGVLELCQNVTGTTTLNASWGFAPGQQIWIGVMSNVGLEGAFTLCVNSFAPAPVGGNTCATAISVCQIGQPITIDMSTLSTSGTFPSCFFGAANQDVWFQFTATSTGTIEWNATPQFANNELDWAMYNITSGCPGTEVACNYNYDFANGSPVGMNNAIQCVACPTSGTGGACGEYCTEYNVIAGNTYAIMIDIFSGTIGDLTFEFTNGTVAGIAPVAAFTVTPSVICGPNMSVAITDNNVGGTPSWTFGNGNSYSGSNPPNETYNTPGTYAITATIADPNCPATHTEFVQLIAPVTGSSIDIDETCPGSCDGSSIANNIAGGDGVYAYDWQNSSSSTIGTANSIGSLCAGTYTLYVTSSICPTVPISVTIGTANALDNPAFSTTPSCDGGTSTVTGTGGGSFSFSIPPGDGAVINPNTGEVTGGTPGATYNIQYLTNGVCPDSSIQTVTALSLDDPSFTMSASCDGGVAVVTGTAGGTFAFNTPPGDGATINPTTGVVSGGTPGNTYDIIYVTNGICPDSTTQMVTATQLDDPSFTMTPTCDGGTATIIGTAGGSFAFNTPPGDGAVIDPATGIISGGTPGATYDVIYVTAGVCSDSSTQMVTANTLDDPTFTMSATCDGGLATIVGASGGSFSFTVAPIDGAVIDPATGIVSGGTPGTSYSIQYLTAGQCPDSMTITFNATSQDDPSFTLTPTCSGALASNPATPGGTYSFDVPPIDGAVIDPSTGAVSNGTPGNTYTILYVTNGPCIDSLSQAITAYNLPLAPTAGTDAVYCSSDVYAAMTAFGGSGTFNWYADPLIDSILLGTGAFFDPLDNLGTSTYYVTEIENGCEGPASMVVITIEQCAITIPTAFTPDGDGVNDYWNIVDLDDVYPNSEVFVYNRWGSEVYASEKGDYNGRPWNGRFNGQELPVGSYFFVIELNDKNNESKTGSISIIHNKK